MKIPKKRTIFVLLITAALFAPAESIVLPALFSSPESACPAEWVRAHASQLPRTLIDIKAFPVIYRKAILRALPVETQAALWRAHFVDYLEANPSLSQSQVEVVGDALALCTVATFTRSPEVASAIEALDARARAAFTRSQAAELFERFGPPPPTSLAAVTRPSSLRVRLATWYHTAFLARATNQECTRAHRTTATGRRIRLVRIRSRTASRGPTSARAQARAAVRSGTTSAMGSAV
jgi:hypothetical protein